MPLTRIPVELGPVQQTLLVPLWARAQEAAESAPVLHDPRATEVCERLDYDFTLLEKAQSSRLGCCVRGRLVDRWVRAFLDAHASATVVELGCGLNSRFERLDDGRVRWFDLDLPDVVALRRRFFTDSERRTTLAGCVRENAWMDAVAAAGEAPVLFVSEGLFVYLLEDEVRSVFERLARRFPGSAIVFDAMTPLVLKHQRYHDAMRHFAARFTWAVPDARVVERWGAPIRLEESRCFYDLLYAQARRIPAPLRWLGRAAGFLYPPLKRAYTINLARLG